ncbi:MAG: ScyD/ScyE family protein [Pyrinomonadaceae bacterium]|nr:ScyD/ScyE family protein [Pyrinomonadaceae bacterium]
MIRKLLPLFLSVILLLSLVVSVLLLAGVEARAQCTEVVSGLRIPLGITQSNKDNLIVSETGTGPLHSGRISIVDPNGSRRTLLNGLPSAINDVLEPSGPAGVSMRGRTLYVVIGIGNSIVAGGPGVAFENPNPSSPLFSSILALHFSASTEKNTTGFALSFANQVALASGQKVTLSNGAGEKLTIELIVNFPNFTPKPGPPGNVSGSNPFDLVIVGNQIYVTDGGQNSVWQVDLSTGAFSTLVTFPPVTNTLFPGFGPPFSEAVPTGIAYADGQLLVTLFTGFPFPPGASRVEQVDPSTGAHSSLITGRKTAIDVLPINEGSDTDYLVLQYASPFGPFFPPPGLLLLFETPGGPPTTVASCMTRPTSIVLDEKTGTLYITELGPGPPSLPTAGRVVSVPFTP